MHSFELLLFLVSIFAVQVVVANDTSYSTRLDSIVPIADHAAYSCTVRLANKPHYLILRPYTVNVNTWSFL